MTDFSEDFRWQMKFLPAIRFIVGPLLLEPAPMDIDMGEATDMLILRARDMRIGCRVRRPKYASDYPWDFTIREVRPSGAKTEFRKIIEGWGDWMLYGHAEHDDLPALARWLLIDLHAFRAHLILNRDDVAGVKKTNNDGTKFRAFDVRQFPADPPILVASSHDVPVGVPA